MPILPIFATSKLNCLVRYTFHRINLQKLRYKNFRRRENSSIIMKLFIFIKLCFGQIFFEDNEWKSEGWSSLIWWKIEAETERQMCFINRRVELERAYDFNAFQFLYKLKKTRISRGKRKRVCLTMK